MTPFETVLFIVKRLAGIYTKDEVYLFERKLKQPYEFYARDGKNSAFYSLSALRALVKNWRKTAVKDFSQEEYEQILKEVNEGLADMRRRGFKPDQGEVRENEISPGVEFKAMMSVSWTNQELSGLPMLTGYFPTVGGTLAREPVVIDTAASISIVSAEKFRSWGVDLRVLDKRHKFAVETAGGVVHTEGSYATFFYCQTGKKFYKVPVTLLVLRSAIKKVLIGISSLRQMDYALSCTQGVETLRIMVITSGNKRVARKFETFNLENQKRKRQVFFSEGLQVNNLEGVSEDLQAKHLSGLSDTARVSVRFSSGETVLNSDLVCDLYDEEGEAVSKNYYKAAGEVVTTVNMVDTKAGSWPDKATHSLTLEVPRKVLGDEGLQLVGKPAQAGVDTEDFAVLMGEALDNLEEADMVGGEGDPTLQCEEEIYKRLGAVSLDPPDQQPVDRYWEPDLTGVPDQVRGKFAALFEEYKDVFSPDNYTVPRARLPEVSLQLKPGMEAPRDKPRPLRPEQAEIMSEILDKMLKANYIEEITGNPSKMHHSNHAVFLVSKKMGLGADQKVQNKMEDQTPQERLATLRAGCRFVSDFRSLNLRLAQPAPLGLPSFQTEINLYNNAVASTLDICSGFYALALDAASKDLCQFVVGERAFRYLVLAMGLSPSPGIFTYLMSVVLNRKDFQKYMVEVDHPETLAASFFRAVSRYIDDCGLIASREGAYGGYFLLYHLWVYVLRQFREYKITLSAKKIEIGKHKITLLGFNICLKTSTYSISARRQRAFKDLRFPRNPAQLKALLCTLCYFDRALLATRCLVTMLVILSNDQEEYHYTETHQREFLCLLWSFEVNLAVRIPNPGRKLFLSSDASFSSYCGYLWQMRNLQPGEKVETDNPTAAFELVGIFSRSFSSAEYSASILSKELTGLFRSLEIFYSDIVNNQVGCLIFVDFQALTILSKLRFANPRLHRYNMLLASLPRTEVCVSKSASTNFLADLISRLNYTRPEYDPHLVPAKYLDYAGSRLPEGTMLSAGTVRKLVEMPLPEVFSQVPRRTQLPPSGDLAKLSQLFDGNVVTEEALCKAVYFGYDSIPTKSVVFGNPKTQRVISRGDFEKLSKDYDHGKIRKYLNFTKIHSHCPQSPGEFRDILRDFLHKLGNFMSERGLEDIYPGLYSEVRKAEVNQELTTEEFALLHTKISEMKILQPVPVGPQPRLAHFVIIRQGINSNAKLRAEESELVIQVGREVNIDPGQTTIVKLNLTVNTELGLEPVVEASNNHPQVAGFLCHRYQENRHHILSLLLHNAGEARVQLEEGHPLVRVKTHRYQEPCLCGGGEVVVFISSQGGPGGDRELKMATVLISDLIARQAVAEAGPDGMRTLEEDSTRHHKDIFVTEMVGAASERPEWDTLEADPNIPARPPVVDISQPGEGRQVGGEPLLGKLLRNKRLATAAQPKLKDVKDQAYINRLLFLGSLFGAGSTVLKKSFLIKLQESCPVLAKIKERVLQNTATAFHLRDGVLYRHQQHRPQFRLQLCLNEEAYQVAADSIHGAGRHLSVKQLSLFLNQYVWCHNYPLLVQKSIEKCPVCLFNAPARRLNFVNDPHRESVASLGRVWSADFMQDLPSSRRNMKFLLVCIEESTGYGVFYAQRDLSTSSTIASLENLFKSFPLPLYLRTDFASCFSSREMQHFLRQHKVLSRKSCPGRAPENGASERGVAITRQILSTILLHEGGPDSWLRWDEYLIQLTHQYNNITFYAQNQIYSRAFLFLGPLFHSNNQFIAGQPSGVSPDWADPAIAGEEERCRALARILKARQEFSKKYKIFEPSFFVPGCLVFAPQTKEEKRRRAGNSGTASSVPTVYRVLGTNDNSVRLQCIFTGDETTKSFSELKLLPPEWLSYYRGTNILQRGGVFEDNIFKAGKAPLFEKIEREEAEVERLAREAEQVPGAEEEISEEEEEQATQEAMENERDRLAELAEQEAREQEGTVSEGQEQLAGSIRKLQQTRYNLRPRKKSLSVNILQTHRASPAKSVRWDHQVSVVDFDQHQVLREGDNVNLFNPRREDLEGFYYTAALFFSTQEPEPGLSFRELSLRDEVKCYITMMSCLRGHEYQVPGPAGLPAQ